MEPIRPVPFDIVTPFHEKDAPVFWNYTIPHLQKNAVGLKKIYIVCSENCMRSDLSENIIFINENKYPFTKEEIFSYTGRPRLGWYYQQLLKLYAHQVIRDLSEYYVIWDSDTILLKPTPFFHDDYGEVRALFAISPEYNPPYMEHMHRLLPSLHRYTNEWGGVTHHQPWMVHILKELFRMVESRHGCMFWKAYLRCVEQKHFNGSGCADYEIVLAYAMTYFGGEVIIRPLRWANRRQLPDINENLDFVSLHEHMMPLVPMSKS